MKSRINYIYSSLEQVFVVVGPASVIAFIIRDLGSPGLVGWIIQGLFREVRIVPAAVE